MPDSPRSAPKRPRPPGFMTAVRVVDYHGDGPYEAAIVLGDGTGMDLGLAALTFAGLEAPAREGMVVDLGGEVRVILTKSFKSGPAVKGVDHAWYAKPCLE